MNTLKNTTRSEAIELGAKYRSRMEQTIKRTLYQEGVFSNHLYISSQPGIGKTFTTTKLLQEMNQQFVKISGNTSMFAFGVCLAVARFIDPVNKIIFLVDDCDVLFNELNCNIMKNVLSGLSCYHYEKSLQSQWGNLTPIQQQAIEFHQTEGEMGFSVPTNNMLFIINSNFRLPTDDEVRIAREKNRGKSILIINRNAIRSRCRVLDLDITGPSHYGWIADVVLNTDCLEKYNIDDLQKRVILDFLWDNWPNLKERSIRLVEKMARIMNEYPLDYHTVWEMDYLKIESICHI